MENEKLKSLKLGDTVWIQLTGNAVRGKKNRNELIEAWKITKVGRKYITAKPTVGREIQFIKNNTQYKGLIEKTKYSIDYVLYKDKQDILDKLEKGDIIRSLRKVFYDDFKGLSLDKLRRIKQVIDE